MPKLMLEVEYPEQINPHWLLQELNREAKEKIAHALNAIDREDRESSLLKDDVALDIWLREHYPNIPIVREKVYKHTHRNLSQEFWHRHFGWGGGGNKPVFMKASYAVLCHNYSWWPEKLLDRYMRRYCITCQGTELQSLLARIAKKLCLWTKVDKQLEHHLRSESMNGRGEWVYSGHWWVAGKEYRIRSEEQGKVMQQLYSLIKKIDVLRVKVE